MGRPKLNIDPKLVEQFASIGCKTTEIADYFNCDEDTITNRFSAELTKGRTNLKMSLRRWQLSSAQKGNIAMQIWLGKQMLGQQDRATLDINKIPDEVFIAEAQKRLEDGTDK